MPSRWRPLISSRSNCARPALDANAALTELLDDGEEVDRGTRQPIEASDNQHIAFAHKLQQRLQFFAALNRGATDLFRHDAFAAGGLERLDLPSKAVLLVFRA